MKMKKIYFICSLNIRGKPKRNSYGGLSPVNQQECKAQSEHLRYFPNGVFGFQNYSFSYFLFSFSVYQSYSVPFVSQVYHFILSFCFYLIPFQFSVSNQVLAYLGLQGESAMKVFRPFRCLRPLRAMSRLEGLKVSHWTLTLARHHY